MDHQDFKRLLFDTAFCCMACDGHIDQREVDELKFMDKNTAYFDDVDLSSELQHLIDRFSQTGKKTVEDLFTKIKTVDLNTVQELLMLEVVLRLINADETIDDNEVKFVRFLRAKLKVHDATIIERFGNVELLFDKDYGKEAASKKYYSHIFDSLAFPDIDQLKSIDLSQPEAKE